MRIFVCGCFVVVLLVGEEGEGGKGVVRGFCIPGAVLEEVQFVRREVLRGRWGSFPSGLFVLFGTFFGGSGWKGFIGVFIVRVNP